MKIWKVLTLVLAMAVAAPAVSMGKEGHAARSVASEKTKKKGKKGKGAKHAKGKKKGAKHAKGKKGKKGQKAAHASGQKKHGSASGSAHQSHAPSDSKVEEPVPSVNIPAEPAADLPPPNTGALSE